MSITLSFVKKAHLCIYRGNRWFAIRFFFMDVTVFYGWTIWTVMNIFYNYYLKDKNSKKGG